MKNLWAGFCILVVDTLVAVCAEQYSFVLYIIGTFFVCYGCFQLGEVNEKLEKIIPLMLCMAFVRGALFVNLIFSFVEISKAVQTSVGLYLGIALFLSINYAILCFSDIEIERETSFPITHNFISTNICAVAMIVAKFVDLILENSSLDFIISTVGAVLFIITFTALEQAFLVDEERVCSKR